MSDHPGERWKARCDRCGDDVTLHHVGCVLCACPGFVRPVMESMTREEYLAAFSAPGGHCWHPFRHRRPLPWRIEDTDPEEWECGVCGFQQVYVGISPSDSPSKPPEGA